MRRTRVFGFDGTRRVYSILAKGQSSLSADLIIQLEVAEMSDLNTRFEAAVADSQSLGTQPPNDVLLRLYALYKQATAGDVEGSRPGFTDMRGRAKYDAWAAIAGTDNDEAMAQYVEQIEELKKKL